MEKGSHVHMDDYIFISQANSFVQILFRAARKIKKKHVLLKQHIMQH